MKDKAIDVLKLIRKGKTGNEVGLDGSVTGVYIIQAVTESPPTFIFDGTSIALDLNLFLFPSSFLPIRKGDRYFVLPIVGGDTQRWQRWSVLQRL